MNVLTKKLTLRPITLFVKPQLHLQSAIKHNNSNIVLWVHNVNTI